MSNNDSTIKRDTNDRGCIRLWMPIPSIPGYEAGSDGSIRSVDREIHHPLGGLSRIRGKDLKQWPVSSGYLTFRTTGKTHMVSRAVLEAFIGFPESKSMHACHNNGDKTDNRVENLRWDTPKGNEADKRMHGTDCRGTRHPAAKLTPELVDAIRKDSRSERVMATAYGISKSHAGSIRRGAFWKI